MADRAGNVIYYGDNLDLLRRHVKDEGIDQTRQPRGTLPPMRGDSGRRALRLARDVATAALRHPRPTARLAVGVDRPDIRMLADVLVSQLPERDLRRLTVSLLAREPTQITCVRDGLTWEVDVGDVVGESIYLDGGYSTEEIGAVLFWLATRTGSTVIEVGANVGTTTVPLAKAGYRVMAIEPVPRTFAMLARNVEANDLADRVRCVNRAIATTCGQVEMWVTRGTGVNEIVAGDAPPGFSVYGPAFDDAKRRVTVEGDRLDHLLDAADVALDDVALVWSDTQGSETSVIDTGAPLWAAGVPLYAEVAPWLLESRGGIDAFVRSAERHFDSFLARDALIGRGPSQPIGHFRAFVESLDVGTAAYSDALLVPRSDD